MCSRQDYGANYFSALYPACHIIAVVILQVHLNEIILIIPEKNL